MALITDALSPMISSMALVVMPAATEITTEPAFMLSFISFRVSKILAGLTASNTMSASRQALLLASVSCSIAKLVSENFSERALEVLVVAVDAQTKAGSNPELINPAKMACPIEPAPIMAMRLFSIASSLTAIVIGGSG